MQQVLVLNASYEPLNVTTVRRAHVLVFKGKAEVIEELDQPLRSATDTFPWPHVIRLVHYVRVPRTLQRKISRRALFARDGWRCMYCGTTSGRLTLDHVVPRSPRRRLGLGERRHLVRALQHAQGQPAAARDRDAAAQAAPRARAGALHPPRTPKIPNRWQPYLTASATRPPQPRPPSPARPGARAAPTRSTSRGRAGPLGRSGTGGGARRRR